MVSRTRSRYPGHDYVGGRGFFFISIIPRDMSSISNEEKLSIAVKAGAALVGIIAILVVALYFSIGNTETYKNAANNENVTKVQALNDLADLQNDYDNLRD